MLRSITALSVLALSATAVADDFDYTYFNLNYGQVEFDDVDVDGDGFGVSGAFAVNPNWHLFGDYTSAGLDFGVDATEFGVGLGYNTSLTNAVDIIGRVSYEYIEFEGGGGSADETGYGLGVGLRMHASPKLEINGGLDYMDLGDGDETLLSVGGLYTLTPSFALGFGGSWSDDRSTYTATGRFYFGN